MRAAEQVTWREVPVFRGLMAMRSPGRLHLTADEPVFGMFVGAGFEVLARTPEEILIGGIQRFYGSRTTVRLPRPDLAAFRDFDDPGCIKIGLNFRHLAPRAADVGAEGSRRPRKPWRAWGRRLETQ
jgi:hypothetical protein